MMRLFPALLLLALSLTSIPAGAARKKSQDLPSGVRQIGIIKPLALKESSGVVASRNQKDVFWTHNDGGGGRRQILYAINRQGDALGEFLIAGLALSDWEDIANDESGHLYIGDVGNNDVRKDRLFVHRINEPDIHQEARAVRPDWTWELRFPEAPFDCESLFIHQGFGYVISKVFDDARAAIYRFPLTAPEHPVTLEMVTRLPVTSPVTGADISVDGRLLGIVSKAGPFVFLIEGNVERAGTVKPHRVRFRHEDIEGCCFVPEGLLATAESREIFLFIDPAFRPVP